MTTWLNIQADTNGRNAYGLPPSDLNYSSTLTQSSDTTITIPSNVSNSKGWYLICTYTPGASVWVAKNATAAVPAGNTFASTTSALNRTGIIVTGGDVLHFITSETSISVGISFYAIPE